LAPAADSLRALLDGGAAGTFDFVFVDADKAGYLDYLERAFDLLRPGGLLAFDNVLWGGRVADASVNDTDTLAIRALNAKLHGDARFDLSLVPIGDGLTLARRRP
jgi:O-methyltransferase